MLKLLFVLIVGSVIQINGENLPVFLWGHKTSTYLPALKHLEGEEFVTLVKSQAKEDTKTVIFIEESLSVEDFSQCKLRTKTCFKNLQNVDDKTFLNSVQDPVNSLIESFGKKKTVEVSSADDLKNVDDEKILLVHLGKVENPEDFDKHDNLMNKIFVELKAKYGDVLAIYTGRQPSFKYSEPLVRKAREAAEEKKDEKPVEEKPAETKPAEAKQAAPAQKPSPTIAAGEYFKIVHTPRYEWEESPFFYRSEHLLIAVNSIVIFGVNETENSAPTFAETLVEGQMNMTIKITVNSKEISMVAVNETGRWEVHSFVYNNEVFYQRSRVYGFSPEWSWGCSNFTLETAAPLQTESRKFIHLIGFRIQPSWEKRDLGKDADGEYLWKFGSCNDCTGFFSAGIWGALFVIFLLLFIMSWGIMNMMDIRTMDRFDDPKGKTIIINATE